MCRDLFASCRSLSLNDAANLHLSDGQPGISKTPCSSWLFPHFPGFCHSANPVTELCSQMAQNRNNKALDSASPVTSGTDQDAIRSQPVLSVCKTNAGPCQPSKYLIGLMTNPSMNSIPSMVLQPTVILI